MAHLVLIAGIFTFVFIQLTTIQGQEQGTCQNTYNRIYENGCIMVKMDRKSTNITVDCSENCRPYYDNFISDCTPAAGDYVKVSYCSGRLQINT